MDYWNLNGRKHYKLTEESIQNIFGNKLFRVELTEDCIWGKKGDKGGYIEKEDNLQNCAWVDENAQVFDNGIVSGYAWIGGNAMVAGDALVSGHARIFGNAWITGNARVHDAAKVFDNVNITGNSRVYNDAEVRGNMWINGDSDICGINRQD